ncbi:MAG TPA: hypothetical protein VKG82_09205 [Solirubrobacteraceae bacterium]|nr:hypothetical protein [Solirubrobacteraceae bacterium]
MIARPSAWLAASLAAGALLGGCGGSSSSSSSSSPSPAATTSGAAGGGPSSPSTSGEHAVSPADAEAALAACKQAVQAQTSLSSTVRGRLEVICQKAASGNHAAVVQAAREVCEEVIKSSSLPAGTAKEQALAGCRKTQAG